MAKWGKKLLGLAAIGGAAAGLVYYLKSKEELDLDEINRMIEQDNQEIAQLEKEIAEQLALLGVKM